MNKTNIKNYIVSHKSLLQTGVALFSMAAIVVALAVPLTALPTTSRADSNSSSNSTSIVSNSGNSSSNSTVNVNTNSTSGTACNTGCTYPPTTGTCVASASTANIGDTVSFTVHPAGGTGGYQYDWDGTDGITGHSPTVSQSFSTSGVKTAHVVIYSNGTPAQANCSVTVKTVTTGGGCTTGCTYPPTTGTCVASASTANIGDTVSFTVHPAGGTGGYQYDWDGTDGITGHSPTVSQSFSTSGVKTAHVVIYSNGTPAQANCSVTVRQPVTPVSAICNVNVTSANVGDMITFSASATGGSNDYGYLWNGSDGISGNSQSMQKTFSTAGSKHATVTVTSGTLSATATCNVTIIIVQAPISVVCDASATVINTGSSVTYTASATGGSGTYGYSWNGSNNMTGTNQTMTQTYSTAGSKTATVTVYSNGKTASATCNVTVNIIVVNNPVSVVCYVNNSSVTIGSGVTYTATATGGNNGYTYSWTGSNGMTGSNSTAYMSYPNAGSQYATVTVSSDGHTATATCNTNVTQPYIPQNTLSVYCVANPSTINVGQNMTWTAYATGGNGGNYTYSWNGTNGYSNTYSNTYQNAGQVNMTVTVTSNGQTASANCQGYVNQQYIQPVQPIVTVTPQPPVTPVPPSSGVYLSAIPATGISSSMKTDLFVAGLFIWSAFAAYLFLARRNGKLAVAAMTSGIAPVDSTVAMPEVDTATAAASLSEKIGDMARASNILFSHDALTAIAARANGDEATAGSLVTSIAAKIGGSENFTTVNLQKLNELTA